eukprot:TRINITY_DN43094_c0_g1_i1.p1 TRINITY_DN43094_c0_g1~~TRINITY_DN43094_c0_g1_i1.p1  ORF type:complete len:645 (-),score=160.80 TRINITY_DN43094_c0_g1_i1:52-1920(-)
MPGYGYGDNKEARRRRRQRSASSSSSSSATQEKRSAKDGKRSKRTANRSSGKKKRRADAAEDEPHQQMPQQQQAQQQSQRSAALAAGARDEPQGVGALGGRKRDWREELERAEEAGDDDGGVEGIVPMEDDEEVERKLAESRARRETLIAKWVNRGEGQEGGGLHMPDTNTSMDGVDGSDSDNEVIQFFAEKRKQLEGESVAQSDDIEEKKAVNRFIQQQKAERDGDMFTEDGEDQDALRRGVNQSAAISQTGASADDWNDPEGYYNARIGEVMDTRYKVVEDNCGKGVFSNVIKAKDLKEKSLVAIKIMRCNDMMKKAAEKEIEILRLLNRADKGNKKNVIRLLKTFPYRGHLCLVFECMWDNLRVALKKYTKDKGMSLRAVRAYTKQLLVALSHIHRCGIIHADIKPDNILISAGHNLVKICDLGSAMELTEVEQTPYLVSRFYRAPEIVLAAKYGQSSDTFALGASLFEIFCGKILFPGRSNNDMLRHFMDLKGKLPHKMIKSGLTWKNHFDENLDFKFVDVHKATKKKVTRIVTDCSAKRSILDLVMQRVGVEKQRSENKEDQLYVKKAKQFAELINQMTTIDPERRPSPEELLKYPFLSEAGLGPLPPKDAKAQPAA